MEIACANNRRKLDFVAGRIDLLNENGYLSPDICNALHYVRKVGNQAAHDTRVFRYSEALLS